MKQLIILVFCVLLYNCCNSQQNDNFDLFLNNFKVCEYPINSVDVFHSLEQEWEHYISETDFMTYLRKSSDSIWIFDKEHQYVYGGKFDVSSDLFCVFYRRIYFADDIDNQISENILCTFNHNGELISDLPIAGGYGDSVTFTSIIHNSKRIEVNYKEYTAETVNKTSKHFNITESGEIKIIE